VYNAFEDDEGWEDGVFSCADLLDDYYPLSIAWLDEFRSRASLGACDDRWRRSNIRLKASSIEFVYVIIVDAVLGFGIISKVEPRLDYPRIFLEFPLVLFCSIESHFELF
jgi:hypothetical protein